MAQRVEVNFNGSNLEAHFDEQLVVAGPNLPSPYDYFSASTAMCAGVYVRQFCKARNIPHENIKIVQEESFANPDSFKMDLHIKVMLPKDFPEKYKGAVLMAAEQCLVKKVVQAEPNFTVSTETF